VCTPADGLQYLETHAAHRALVLRDINTEIQFKSPKTTPQTPAIIAPDDRGCRLMQRRKSFELLW